MNDNAFLGTITHNGGLDYRMAKAFFVTATRTRQVMFKIQQTSLLAGGCNNLWCDALNNRSYAQLKWFAMLHADVVPEDFWLDSLIGIAETNDADVVSAVVPIKDSQGVTSTAIGTRDPFRRYCRLTMQQVNHPKMPRTFSIDTLKSLANDPDFSALAPAFSPDFNDTPYLLVNTGCFVCRLDRPWSTQVFFTIRDRIEQALGGAYVAAQEPEDWFFSRAVAAAGGRVLATSQVKVEHVGSVGYKSNTVWGNPIDPAILIEPVK